MWTFEFRLQNTITRKAGHVETIAMWITNENIASIRNINAIGEASDLLIANAILKGAIFLEDNDAVSLKVADIEVIVWIKRKRNKKYIKQNRVDKKK